ncbi:MAG: hypothetical protein EXX96DRAFT_583600 [Benjaminiella poitrasii]|nr:MAG: hypothetical protein EXX96DRAFT_583600 [Benjaminiella poitrasii]
MGGLRALKSKSWASLVSLVIITFYLITSWNAASSSSSSSSKTVLLNQQATYIPNTHIHSTRLQVLSSALAHIRLGYVANRTPYYSTPPLLVLYSCHHDQQCKQSFDERMIATVNSYYFSMLQQGSAFAYDMTWPVKWEWYFDPSPAYMSMNSDQANYYVEKAVSHQIKEEAVLSQHELRQRPFSEDYSAKQISIVNVGQWEGDWLDLGQNPSMQSLRDKYRLNHLEYKSEWFWIASRLLFSRPTEGFQRLLEPYSDLIGDKLDASIEHLPSLDYTGQVIPHETTHKKDWFRVGLRVDQTPFSDRYVACLVTHITSICRRYLQKQQSSCHVFISAHSRDQLNRLRAEFRRHPVVAVHAVAEGYDFIDLNRYSPSDIEQSGKDESRLRKKFARPFMDWTILSRMDYLVGFESDQFLKTAAWAAQVRTDVLATSSDHCQIEPMSDW